MPQASVYNIVQYFNDFFSILRCPWKINHILAFAYFSCFLIIFRAAHQLIAHAASKGVREAHRVLNEVCARGGCKHWQTTHLFLLDLDGKSHVFIIQCMNQTLEWLPISEDCQCYVLISKINVLSLVMVC